MVSVVGPSLSLACYGLSASEAVAVAVKAEQVGFDGIWLGEHLLTPGGYSSPHPYVDPTHPIPVVDPKVPVVDTIAVLGAISVATSRIFIATGIYLLPLRHPLITALAARTIDALSRGRFMLGVGTGWLREEFEALGVNFQARGELMWEATEVVRGALAGGMTSNSGRHFPFRDVLLGDDPVDVPLIFGGETESALRRAARYGDGWHSPSSATIKDFRRVRSSMERLLADEGRTAGDFAYHVRVRDLDPSSVEECHDAGFTNVSISTLTLWKEPIAVSLERKLEDVERLSAIFVGGSPGTRR